jgi:predicted CXXCH cytochrome family protein
VKLLVITQSRNRAGRTVQVKKEVNADWIRVGRAASSEVLLADPRVALNQGLILDRDGPVYTEGEMGNLTSTTKKAVRSVRLKPGTSVDVGPYKITALDTPEGFSGAITVELVRPQEDVAPEFMARANKLTLRSLHLPKRWLAIGLFALIAVVFFLLPAGRVLDLPWKGSQTVAMASDRFWNPGHVMLAHQPIELKCEACHEVAFRQVLDSSCLECHQKIGHHVGQDLKPAVLFQGTRCAECHRDHKGVKTTHRDDDRFCVECHKDVRGRANGAQSQNVTDFEKDHPAFRLSIPVDKGVKRVRMGSGPVEESSNLIFPHEVHLDPKGVRHPDKDKVKLDCAACHRPDASKRTFEPVSMQKHCQECHRLEFEPAVTKRQVPHGLPGDAITVVNEFYANLALNGVKDSFEKAFGVPGEGLLRRVGAPSDAQRQNALALAGKKSAQVSEELFEVRVCRACHAILRQDGPDGKPVWNVATIRANNTWMPHARFDHKSHAQAKCADCHDVAKSKRSQDVAMPKIESCRECHAGSQPAEKKITSNCLLCHGFHEQQHPWDPNFKPKGKTRVAQGAAGDR